LKADCLSFVKRGTCIIVKTSKLVLLSMPQCALPHLVLQGAYPSTRSSNRKKDADMKNSILSPVVGFAAVLLLACAAQAQSTDSNPNPSAPGTSKVRIVRLSQIKGVVQIDRHIGRGFENAITNLPVVEQSQIRTGLGVAEVEFEDNSSLRIAPNSLVEFPRLEREASGATASAVHLVQGTAYVSLVKQQDKKAPVNEFELIFGSRKLNLDPATHVRLDLAGSEAKLAVFDGAVRTDAENGGVGIPKKKTATFQIFDKNEPLVAKDIVANPVLDEWDHNEASYHANVASFNRFNSPYAYGLSDLQYYGSFVNAPGCGSMWRPYFATAGWDPYANGTWAWYGGSGYSWVSPYPWAWTPYHSGTWMNCGDAGWGWLPGRDWYGVNNVASLPSGSTSGTTAGTAGPARIRAPHLPAHPPGPNQPTLIAANSKPLPTSQIATPNSFVFRKDSAGLGVPRGTLGRLDKFSHQTATRGIAQTQIYTNVPQTGRAYGTANQGPGMTGSIYRGSPAPPSYSSGSMGSRSGGNMNSGVSAGSSAGRSGGGAPISAPVASAPVAVHR
jgi:hypothetical protein